MRGPHQNRGFGGCRHAVLAEEDASHRYHCGQEGGCYVTIFTTTVAAAPYKLIGKHFDAARRKFKLSVPRGSAQLV